VSKRVSEWVAAFVGGRASERAKKSEFGSE